MVYVRVTVRLWHVNNSRPPHSYSGMRAANSTLRKIDSWDMFLIVNYWLISMNVVRAGCGRAVVKRRPMIRAMTSR